MLLLLLLLLFETTTPPHKKTSVFVFVFGTQQKDFVVMSARKVGYDEFWLRDDDASLSVSGVARSVFSVFVSPSDDDDEKDDDEFVEVGDTHCVR